MDRSIRPLLSIAAAFAVAALGVPAASPAGADTAALSKAAARTHLGPTNTFMLTNVQTGKCLTIAGGVSTANNVTALQYTCDTDPSRRWRVTDVTGTGLYQIRNVQTGKCLTIAGGVSTANNVEALQFTCDNHPSRRWTLRLVG
ncbi:RICIN domain-containing protein [Sphaerisporangium sp. NPDC088356]|uniref:RICIN domain-containing protein n=1 Tax=Sphaerisporangium sp. NPDC088356 TaxID=3154871 RepID=UPI00341CA441